MDDTKLVVANSDSGPGMSFDSAARPKKSLGQHWLHDQASLQAMCLAAQIDPQDTVLEIGPGLGTLTALLVDQAKKVVAVEYDQTLAEQLPSRVPATNLQVIWADILDFDFRALPPNYKVVANIPYYLTSHLLRRLSEAVNPPSRIVLLVQKEVAERVAAQPGDMSMLAVSVQYYYQASLGLVVPAELFLPPPQVDSQILVLDRRPSPLFLDVDERQFFRLVKAGFSQRRKKLRSSLAGGLQISKTEAQSLLETAGIDADARPQELSLQDWHSIYLAGKGHF